MRKTLRHYGPVAILLAVILLVSTLLSLLTGSRQGEGKLRVLVTNYPLYVAAQNILADTDAVELYLLSGAGAGCLHDYQLTPADRLAIERADKVIINGAGAEPFLEGLVEEDRLVDTSDYVGLLYAPHHHHEDDHHHHDDADYNEHVWLSPLNYIQQVGVVREALMRLDPENAPRYAANGADYIGAIHDGISLKLPNLSDRPCVLFHDSLAYLAADVGLDVKLTLSADGESGLSAADLAQVEELARENPDLILIYDTQYPIRYTAIDGLVPANQVIALETAVVGSGKPSDWLDAMDRNIEKLQKIAGGDTP